MSGVVTAYVIIPLKLFIILAQIPITASINTVYQPTVMQYWQIKTTTIPRDNLWRILIKPIKKALNNLRLS